MKPIRFVRALAIALIVLFSLGTLGVAYAIFAGGFSLLLALALTINIAFVVAGVGLFRVKRWAWWLTLGLCAAGIFQLLLQMLITLTPETATKQAEMATYLVAGFYLAIGFALTSESVRKTFRKDNAGR